MLSTKHIWCCEVAVNEPERFGVDLISERACSFSKPLHHFSLHPESLSVHTNITPYRPLHYVCLPPKCL